MPFAVFSDSDGRKGRQGYGAGHGAVEDRGGKTENGAEDLRRRLVSIYLHTYVLVFFYFYTLVSVKLALKLSLLMALKIIRMPCVDVPLCPI